MFFADPQAIKANISTDQLFLSSNYPQYSFNSSQYFNITGFNLTNVDVNLLASDPPFEVNILYTILEVIVAIIAIVGNAMVICVFQRERRLRRRTNYYIVSLALADLLVGLLGVPFAILASMGLPTNLHACLFTVSLLVVLCTISIFCLVAVSIDRYWAILYPLAYSRNVRTKTAVGELNNVEYFSLNFSFTCTATWVYFRITRIDFHVSFGSIFVLRYSINHRNKKL